MPTIIVYWSRGRSPQQKQALAQQMTQAMVESGDANAEDVVVIFRDVDPTDMIRGEPKPDNHSLPEDN